MDRGKGLPQPPTLRNTLSGLWVRNARAVAPRSVAHAAFPQDVAKEAQAAATDLAKEAFIEPWRENITELKARLR